MSSVPKLSRGSVVGTSLLIFVMMSILPAAESIKWSTDNFLVEPVKARQFVSGCLVGFYLVNSAVNWPTVHALHLPRHGGALSEDELCTAGNSSSNWRNCYSAQWNRKVEWWRGLEVAAFILLFFFVCIMSIAIAQGCAEKHYKVVGSNNHNPVNESVTTTNDVQEIRIIIQDLYSEMRARRNELHQLQLQQQQIRLQQLQQQQQLRQQPVAQDVQIV